MVPDTLSPSMTTFPLLEFNVRSALLGDSIDEPIMDKSPTDIVPNDTNTIATDTLTTTDVSVSGKTYSSDKSEAGLSVAIGTGNKLIPFLDLAYVNEDTTSAAYNNEATADAATADLDASAPDGYFSYGGGVILNLKGRMSGYLSITETTNRTDYSETTVSGSLKLKF